MRWDEMSMLHFWIHHHPLIFCVVLCRQLSRRWDACYPEELMPGHSGNNELGIVPLISYSTPYSTTRSPGIRYSDCAVLDSNCLELF